jgi:betaine reductase
MPGEGVRLAAETLMTGDPSWAGPLAGVSLGLPVFHILEEKVRIKVPRDIYAEKLEMMEMVLDLPRIEGDLAEVRGGN